MTTDTHKQTYLHPGTHADTQELAGPAVVGGAAGSNLLTEKSQRWASKGLHTAQIWGSLTGAQGELCPDRGQ